MSTFSEKLKTTASAAVAVFFLGNLASAQGVADDAGTSARRIDLLFNSHSDSFAMADDIVVAQKLAESGPELRTITQGPPENPFFVSTVFAYVETYRVLTSLRGAATGDVLCVVVGQPNADGTPPALRHRPVGTMVVAALDAQSQGMLNFHWEFNFAEGEVVPARQGEWTLLLSAGVSQTGFAANVSGPNETFLCTAIEGLDTVPREESRRTLTMLMNLWGSTVHSSYGTRTSRALMGKVDALDARDQWMAYAALRLWNMPGLLPNLMSTLVPVATDTAEWETVAPEAKHALKRALATTEDSYRAPDRTQLFPSPGIAIDTLLQIEDDHLVARFIELLPYRNFPGWRETRLRELWDTRSPVTETVLLRAMPRWTGLTDKRLQPSSVPLEDYVNRGELVDFWDAWLSGAFG